MGETGRQIAILMATGLISGLLVRVLGDQVTDWISRRKRVPWTKKRRDARAAEVRRRLDRYSRDPENRTDDLITELQYIIAGVLLMFAASVLYVLGAIVGGGELALSATGLAAAVFGIGLVIKASAALNVMLKARIEQMEANLEKRRSESPG